MTPDPTTTASPRCVGYGTLRIERDRLRQILTLSVPIIGGMVSQNVLNLIDTLMVSRLGPDALAGVGLGGFANFLAIAFITGLSTGVQAMASRRKGEGREDEMAVPLNGGLVLVAAIAVPLSVLLILLAPLLFPLLVDDPAVVAVGVPYVQIRIAGALAVGSNFAFRGYWNGVSRPGLYLRTLVIMHSCNVVISYVLIFGKLGAPELGASGAAVGTMASTYIGTAYYIYLGRRYASDAGFLHGMPSGETLRAMFKLSVPSGLQQVFFAAGLTALFSIVGHVGTPELAAATVLLNITLVAILPGLGLGLASASLVGQALGRGDPDDAERWGWEVVKVAAVIMFVLGLPMLLVPVPVLEQFFDAGDGVPLILATGPLMLVGATISADAAGMVLLNSIMGAGATRTAMVVSIVSQWGIFIPAAIVVGPVLGFGLLGIWIANIAQRMLLAAVLMVLWRRRSWVGIEV
jgi:putative MATE family efflux protein